MSAGQFIPHGYFPLLGYPGLYPLVDARRQVVAAFFSGVNFHVDNLTPFTVRHTQRSVFHVTRFFAENSPQQLFFRRKLGLAPRRNFTHQCVIGTHLGANPYDTGLVKLAQALLPHVGDVPGNLFRAQLGVPGFRLMLGDVDRSEYVLFQQTTAENDGVFEVVAPPAHKGTGYVLSQGQLSLFRGRTVRQHLALLHPVALAHQGALVDAGSLVGAHELHQLVAVFLAVVTGDDDGISAFIPVVSVPANFGNYAGILSKKHLSTVLDGFPFHSGSHQRCLRSHQRH